MQLRFRDLVRTAGQPEAKSLWTDPKRDREFMRAVRENRVLTVIQEPISKRKDFGQIGFHQEAHANYFVFPNPLPDEQKAKVIGINYDAVGESQPSDPVSPKELKARARKNQPKAERVHTKLQDFEVKIRRTAVVETIVTIQARNKRSAREQTLEQMKNEGFDLSKAEINNKIMSLQHYRRKLGQQLSRSQ